MFRFSLSLSAAVILLMNSGPGFAESIELTRGDSSSDSQYAYYMSGKATATGPDFPWFEFDGYDSDQDSDDISASILGVFAAAVGPHSANLAFTTIAEANVAVSATTYEPCFHTNATIASALVATAGGSARSEGEGWGYSDGTMIVGSPTNPLDDMQMDGTITIDIDVTAGVTGYEVLIVCGNSWIACMSSTGCYGHIEDVNGSYDVDEPTFLTGGQWDFSELVAPDQQIEVHTYTRIGIDNTAPTSISESPYADAKVEFTVDTVP